MNGAVKLASSYYPPGFSLLWIPYNCFFFSEVKHFYDKHLTSRSVSLYMLGYTRVRFVGDEVSYDAKHGLLVVNTIKTL